MTSDKQLADVQASDATAKFVSRQYSAPEKALIHSNPNYGFTFQSLLRQIVGPNLGHLFNGSAALLSEQLLAFTRQHFRSFSEFIPNFLCSFCPALKSNDSSGLQRRIESSEVAQLHRD